MSSNTNKLLASIQKIAKVHNIEATAKKINAILKVGFDDLHIITGKLLFINTYIFIFYLLI